MLMIGLDFQHVIKYNNNWFLLSYITLLLCFFLNTILTCSLLGSAAAFLNYFSFRFHTFRSEKIIGRSMPTWMVSGTWDMTCEGRHTSLEVIFCNRILNMFLTILLDSPYLELQWCESWILNWLSHISFLSKMCVTHDEGSTYLPKFKLGRRLGWVVHWKFSMYQVIIENIEFRLIYTLVVYFQFVAFERKFLNEKVLFISIGDGKMF